MEEYECKYFWDKTVLRERIDIDKLRFTVFNFLPPVNPPFRIYNGKPVILEVEYNLHRN